MLNTQQLAFLNATAQAATAAKHIWPRYAACEAALESGYGISLLARQYHNLFGMKRHYHDASAQFVALPTKEFLHGVYVSRMAQWAAYPNDQACYADRMRTLTLLAPHFANYRAALNAITGADYIDAVSRTWSTDPERAQKVLLIAVEWQRQEEPIPNAITRNVV